MTAAIPELRSTTEQISGVIERVTFHNQDGDFCVLRVKTKGAPGENNRHRFVAIGDGGGVVTEGCWVRNREHGLQIQGDDHEDRAADHGGGDRAYLGNGLVKGLGPILAKKLVGRFGVEVLAVIENRTAELQSVDGMGAKRRERIAHAWQEAKQAREIMLHRAQRSRPHSAEDAERPALPPIRRVRVVYWQEYTKRRR